MAAGWSDLGGQARKFHYFVSDEPGTQALCNKWAIGRKHPLQPDGGKPSPDDCVACRRRFESRVAS
jgi:hypothetical protein